MAISSNDIKSNIGGIPMVMKATWTHANEEGTVESCALDAVAALSKLTTALRERCDKRLLDKLAAELERDREREGAKKLMEELERFKKKKRKKKQ